jgi:hypothetical protein
MFLGLSTAEWTAIGTIALVAVTARYVYLTGKLAKASSEAATAAQQSAASTARSATAMERSVQVAEAGLDVDFEAEFVFVEDNTPEQWIQVRATGRSRVYLHGVSLFAYHHRSDEPQIVAGDLDAMHPRDFPISLRHGDTVIVEWPGGRVDLDEPHGGLVKMRYGFSNEPTGLETAERSLEFPPVPDPSS